MVASAQTQSVRLASWLKWGMLLGRPFRLIVLIALMASLGSLMRSPLVQAAPEGPLPVADVPQAASLPGDGVYLYGQTPEPGQIGVDYMVFEAHRQQIVGALYRPHSSFDCFQGRVGESALTLSIINSYTLETYPYEIALISNDTVATTGQVGSSLQLDGFHQLFNLSDLDVNLLNTCKAALSGPVQR